MKIRIHYLLLLFLLVANGISAQNVSTGLDASYNPVTVGSVDYWWKITAGPNGAASARREATYSPYWQTTPMPTTNACWIDQTGSIFGSTPGDYTFERSFTVNPTDGSIVADFGMAWDDQLISAELVEPGGATIPLSVPVGSPDHYWVGASVNYTVTAPTPGTWKIRVVIRFVDSVGGFILSGEVRHCPQYNISTGIDKSGAAIAVGAADPYWTISAGPGGPVTHRVASFPGYWQPTPVGSTNACWINSTGTYNDPVGIETFDRDFYIPSGMASFTTAFGVAWDDVLVSLELVPPPGGGSNIPLTVPSAPMYMIGPNIGYVVTSPMAGTWKVRANVQFIDQLGGFILSGYISTTCASSSSSSSDDSEKSISQSSESGYVMLYPNPATDELNVEFTTFGSGLATVTLKTIDGKEILHETRLTEAGAQHFRLAIPVSVAAEMIMVEIDNGAEHIIRKVAISKH